LVSGSASLVKGITLSVKKHYGNIIVDWVRDLVRGHEVRPLIVSGPSKSGKSHLIQGLSYWVRTYCLDHMGEFNDGLEFARLLYAEKGIIDPTYYQDKWVEIRHPYRPVCRILNRFAILSTSQSATAGSKIPGALLVGLESKGIDLGDANELIIKLIR